MYPLLWATSSRVAFCTDALCPAGEHRVMWREVSVRQHLQLQHQHVRSLLQVLPGDGAAAALGAALLQRQRDLGQLQHPGAHRLLLPVVLNTHTHTHTHSTMFWCLCWQGGRTAASSAAVDTWRLYWSFIFIVLIWAEKSFHATR